MARADFSQCKEFLEEDEEDWTQQWNGEACALASVGSSKTVSTNEQSKLSTALAPSKIAGDIDSSKSSSIVSRMRLNDNKAGMDGLDKEKINAIIHEASKGSKYYENEVKKEEQVNRRLLEQKQRLDQLTDAQLEEGLRAADHLLEELEKTRDLSRSIVHIDMDMFYAAVEMRDDPTLKTKPMAVGGNSMLSTSNYIARKYGVRAAMPGFIARKLCPDLIIVPTNFAKYTEVSHQVREIMAEYDPNFSPMSLDEAYLDFTDHMMERKNLTEMERTFCDIGDDIAFCACRPRLAVDDIEPGVKAEGIECSACKKKRSTCMETRVFGLDVEEAVREMRHRIHLTTRLTASAGIAPNTMIAKVCSDKNKPNGQFRVEPTREIVMEFIKELPIRKVSGIGKVSETMLRGLGVVSCTHLYIQRASLYHLYSSISFNYFMRICRGLGSSRVERDGERKSMSTERTFSEKSNPEEMTEMCAKLSQALAEDLQEEKLVGKTVTLKIKTVNFEVKTKAHTLHGYTQTWEQINEAARMLLKAEIQACAPKPLRLRLMGVRLSNLAPVSELKKQQQNSITHFLQKSVKPTETNNHETESNEKDSTNTSSFRQRTQEKSLGKPRHQQQERVTCPVCNRVIKTSRMELIHEHINFCLAQSSSEHDTELPQGKELHLSTQNLEEEQSNSGAIYSNSSENIQPDPSSLSENDVNLPAAIHSKTKETFIESQTSPIKSNEHCMTRKSNPKFGFTYIPLYKSTPKPATPTKPDKSNQEKINNEDSCKVSDITFPSANGNESTRKHVKEPEQKTTYSNQTEAKPIREKEVCLESIPVNVIPIATCENTGPADLRHDAVMATNVMNSEPDLHPASSFQMKKLELETSHSNDINLDVVKSSDNVQNISQTCEPIKDEEKASVDPEKQDSFCNHSNNHSDDLHNQAKELMMSVQKHIVSSAASSTTKPGPQESPFDSALVTPEKSMYTCPVCGIKVASTLAFFNKHIDNCLSKQAINEIVSDNNNKPFSPLSKRSPSNSRVKNPKDAKRRKVDKGQTSMANFLSKK